MPAKPYEALVNLSQWPERGVLLVFRVFGGGCRVGLFGTLYTWRWITTNIWR